MKQRPNEDEGPQAAWSGMGQYAGLGLQFAVAVGFFLWVGWKVDGRIGTTPLLTILGAFVGGGAAFYSLYRRLVSGPRDEREKDPPPS
jgi:F0F1-type ATP synthase assembly protein I